MALFGSSGIRGLANREMKRRRLQWEKSVWNIVPVFKYGVSSVRVETKNGWILVRPSGTEPKILITAEARNDVEKLYSKAEKIVKEAIL